MEKDGSSPTGAHPDPVRNAFRVFSYSKPCLERAPIPCPGYLKPSSSVFCKFGSIILLMTNACIAWVINTDATVTQQFDDQTEPGKTRSLSNIDTILFDVNSSILFQIKWSSETDSVVYLASERSRILNALMAPMEAKLKKTYLNERLCKNTNEQIEVLNSTKDREEGTEAEVKTVGSNKVIVQNRSLGPHNLKFHKPENPIMIQGYLKKRIRTGSMFTKALKTEHRKWFKLQQAVLSGSGALLQWSDSPDSKTWKSIVVVGLEPISSNPLDLDFKTLDPSAPVFSASAESVKDSFIWRNAFPIHP